MEITWLASDTNVVIEAGTYYLIERSSDDLTVSDIPYDKYFTGDLSNGGEVLRLVRLRQQRICPQRRHLDLFANWSDLSRGFARSPRP